MQKIIFYLMITLILLVGCSGPVKTEIADSIGDQLNKDEEITKYITDLININNYTSTASEGYSFIRFDVNAEANSDFVNLSDKDKYDVLSKIANVIEENTETDYEFECGEKKICAFDNIEFTNDEDIYSFESLNMEYDLALNHNGEEIYPLEEESVTTTTNEINSSQSNINSTVNEEAVYYFMEGKFEEITNYGENYVPEIHDPQVARLAASRFGISPEEADRIYIDQTMKSIGH
ncbi:hypothetical protein [Bacillus benzoevorans]|uniref:Lipoprotein n=1 Tax=Bacillus benzoevorans TaxID=1456 RepID=A0A7X0LWC7_9BACI|nr:hypothetical protein [Bacillus benzoevorans]MBB6446548.1 hypothetical protein [Bacillus benzoevorans]